MRLRFHVRYVFLFDGGHSIVAKTTKPRLFTDVIFVSQFLLRVVHCITTPMSLPKNGIGTV